MLTAAEAVAYDEHKNSTKFKGVPGGMSSSVEQEAAWHEIDEKEIDEQEVEIEDNSSSSVRNIFCV